MSVRTHTSKRFGLFRYDPEKVIRFEKGLLGMPGCKHFVMKEAKGTAPIRWLVSVDADGPDVPLIDPTILDTAYSLGNIEVTDEMLSELQCLDAASLERFAIVTAPANIRQISMNLRTPILISPESGCGLQYPAPGLTKKPVRCLIYRDLVSGRPEDRTSNIVLKRRLNETIEIGDDITVTVLGISDSCVKLGITGPKNLNVSRGTTPVTARCETRRAIDELNLQNLSAVMQMYRIATEPADELKETLTSVCPTDEKAVG